MSTNLWIIVAVAIVVVVGYLLVMRVFFRQAREVDKHTDYSKIRPIKDEED